MTIYDVLKMIESGDDLIIVRHSYFEAKRLAARFEALAARHYPGTEVDEWDQPPTLYHETFHFKNAILIVQFSKDIADV